MTKKICLMFLTAISAAASFSAQLQIPTVFTDHMVLQREQPLPVWGTSDPNSIVTVDFAGQKKTTTADADGKWKVILDPLPASAESRALKISSSIGNQQLSIGDVLVGEVWFCSGQSNMGFRLKKSENGPKTVAKADYPQIRLYETPGVASATPVDHQVPLTNNPIHNAEACWKVCTPETAQYFSGVAYYFGSKLHQDLNVPVGLLTASVGGSRIETWTAPAGFRSVSTLTNEYQQARHLTKLSGDVKSDRNVPSALFNGMVHAHIPYAIRGAIWYQGESNHEDGMLYVDKMKALLNGWRELWGYEFPLYFVQIAPHQYGEEDPGILPAFWETQSEITKVIPKTGMAVISDAATLGDIHPPNKEVPGTRLALLAEANTYGMNIVSTGPVFKTLEKQNAALKVIFDSADGLATRDGKDLDWFEVAGADGVFKQAKAEIVANNLMLTSLEVPEPVAMRFAWHKLAVPNLVNGAGLPASAFRAGETRSVQSEETNNPAALINPEVVKRAETSLRSRLDETAGKQFYGVLPTGVIHVPPNVHMVGSQKILPDGSVVVDMKLGLQAKAAGNFLMAYEVLGDREYLGTALKTCDFLLLAQQPKGFWLRNYIVTPDGEVKKSSPETSKSLNELKKRLYPDGTAVAADPATICRIQDQYQSENIFLLIYAWRLSGEQKYLDAAKRAADCLLALENENGSWPDYRDFSIPRNQGPASGWFGVRLGGSYNDGATRDSMRVMVTMYFVTKDKKYLARLNGIGPWIFKTQIGEGNVRGWCLQYGADDKPVQARSWEMPVIEPRTLGISIFPSSLLFYLATKDEKYINLIQEAYSWLKSVERPEGWAYQYLPDGTEVFSHDYKVYRYDQPGTWPENHPALYSRKAVNLNAEQQTLDVYKQGGYEALRNHFRRPIIYSPEQYREARRTAAENAAAVKSVKVEDDLRPVLEYLFNARLAEGKIRSEAAAPGGYGLLSLYPGWEWHNRIWKVEDWFDLSL